MDVPNNEAICFTVIRGDSVFVARTGGRTKFSSALVVLTVVFGEGVLIVNPDGDRFNLESLEFVLIFGELEANNVGNLSAGTSPIVPDLLLSLPVDGSTLICAMDEVDSRDSELEEGVTDFFGGGVGNALFAFCILLLSTFREVGVPTE